MPTPDQIERIAAAGNALRPDWPVKSLVTYLTNFHATRPYRDLAAALAYVATDSETKTPKRLMEAGPWWIIGDAKQPTPDMPHPRCPSHGAEYPCPDCRTELTPPAPHHMAAIRAAIPTRTPREDT